MVNGTRVPWIRVLDYPLETSYSLLRLQFVENKFNNKFILVRLFIFLSMGTVCIVGIIYIM